jgi:hypothetical protein
MADGIQEADDFLDRDSLGGRALWVAHATSRLVAAALIGLFFFTGLAVIQLRFEAESALGQGREDAPQPALHQLLANQSLQGVAGLQDVSLRAQAESVFTAEGALAQAVADVADTASRVGEAERQLISAAELANCGLSPTVAVAMTCTGTGDATLVTGLEHAKAGYREAQAASVESQICARAAQVWVDRARNGDVLRPAVAAPAAPAEGAAAPAPSRCPAVQALAAPALQTIAATGAPQSTDGVALAPAVPALREFDNLQGYMPAVAQPAVRSFFSMDSDASILVMAFIAGLLGATCLLFILIAFPNYMPLTFGSGKHFFLRMFTGGVVAFLVVLVLRLTAQTGGAGAAGGPQELAQAQAVLATSGFSEPVRYALIGVVAGFFAEQIAKWAKNYSEGVFSGARTQSAAAPTAAAGAAQTYDAPPEGGPRPAQS